MLSKLRFVVLLPLALAVGACADAPPPVAQAPKTAAAPAEPPPPSLPPGHLRRADVDAALGQGPPWILRRVRTEEVLKDGEFVGWRVLELPAEWAGIDLKAGDVVTRANGMPLEKPDEFFTAWSSLAVASELRLAYQRDGQPRELAFAIDGAGKELPPTLQADAPPPPKSEPAGPLRKTVVIVGDDTNDAPEE